MALTQEQLATFDFETDYSDGLSTQKKYGNHYAEPDARFDAPFTIAGRTCAKADIRPLVAGGESDGALATGDPRNRCEVALSNLPNVVNGSTVLSARPFDADLVGLWRYYAIDVYFPTPTLNGAAGEAGFPQYTTAHNPTADTRNERYHILLQPSIGGTTPPFTIHADDGKLAVVVTNRTNVMTYLWETPIVFDRWFRVILGVRYHKDKAASASATTGGMLKAWADLGDGAGLKLVLADTPAVTMRQKLNGAFVDSGGTQVLAGVVQYGSYRYKQTSIHQVHYLTRVRAKSTFLAAAGVAEPAPPPPAAGAPIVVTNPAQDVGTTTATMMGTYNPNGQATTHWFEYGTTAALGTSTTPAAGGAGTLEVTKNHDLSGLTPDTTYHFQIVAQNPAGTTRGAIRTFSTAPAATSERKTILRPNAEIANAWLLGGAATALEVLQRVYTDPAIPDTAKVAYATAIGAQSRQALATVSIAGRTGKSGVAKIYGRPGQRGLIVRLRHGADNTIFASASIAASNSTAFSWMTATFNANFAGLSQAQLDGLYLELEVDAGASSSVNTRAHDAYLEFTDELVVTGGVTNPTFTSKPTLAGSRVVGEALTVTNGAVTAGSNPTITHSYQFYEVTPGGDVEIAGANVSPWTPAAGLAGKTVYVVDTALAADGGKASSASDPVQLLAARTAYWRPRGRVFADHPLLKPMVRYNTALARFENADGDPLPSPSGVEVLDRQMAVVEISGDALEATAYSFALAAGVLTVGRKLRCSIPFLYFNNTTFTRTFTLRIKLGATTLFSSLTPAIVTSAVGPRIGRLDFDVIAQAAGDQLLSGAFDLSPVLATENGDLSQPGFGVGATQQFRALFGGNGALDMTAAQTLAVTIQHANSDTAATKYLRRQAAILELV